MKRSTMLIISLLFIHLAGCSFNYTAPLMDIRPEVPFAGNKEQVAILIPPPVQNYAPVAKDEGPIGLLGSMAFPLGQLVKKTSLDVFSRVFDKVILIEGKPYPADIGGIIIPTVEEFHYHIVYGSGGSQYVNTSITLNILFTDREGRRVWQGRVKSPSIQEQYYMSSGSLPRAAGASAAKAVAEAFKASAATLTKELLARSEREPAAPKTAPETRSMVKSDIDDLPAALAKPNKNSYAVVIGIENYRQKLPKADYADHDAQTMTEYLSRVMGYPEENIVTLLNEHATNVDLAKYFEKWLPNNVEAGGTVFVYYSGHGAPNPKTGDAYLVPYDGDPQFIDQTGYSLRRMYDALGKLPAKEIIVVLDSCFSGAGGRSVLAEGARPLVMNLQKSVILSRNMTVMAAASGDQISSTYRDKGHGLFTYFLLKGIKNEHVTRPDGSIKIDDLFGYIKPQVERIARKQYNNEQTPQLMEPAGNEGGK